MQVLFVIITLAIILRRNG